METNYILDLLFGWEITMKKSFFYIAQCGICTLPLFHSALVTQASAETMRIIGDRAPAVQGNSGTPTGGEPSSSSAKGSSIIRIVGDRQFVVRKPSAKQPPAPPAAIETAEQQLAQRLDSLKAEEQCKAAEKAGHDQPARLKAEQEQKAALLAAIEQEQRGGGNAEEQPTATERCIEPLTAADKCMEAAETVAVEKLPPHGQAAPAAPSAEAPQGASPAAKHLVSEKAAPLPEQILAVEPAKQQSPTKPGLPLDYWLMQMRTQWRLH